MDITERKITKIAREAEKLVLLTMREEGVGTAEIDLIHALRHHPGCTQAALAELLRANGMDPAPYERTSRLRACLNQYGLLTGCRGDLPYAVRRALFAEILADPDARAALRERLQHDPHRLLALPYRAGVALHWPGLLAAYTIAKQPLLQGQRS